MVLSIFCSIFKTKQNRILEDIYLIAGLNKRDTKVFDFVFTYYYSGLCVFANRYLNDSDEAEDVVQDMFVKLWSNAGNLGINSSLKGFLATTVRNKCLNIIKHRKIEEKYRTLQCATTPEPIEEFPLYTQSELEDVFDGALKKLPPRCRQIFEKSRFEGMNNQSIADELGLSKRTVELQISNALKILREELKPLMPLCMVLWLLK